MKPKEWFIERAGKTVYRSSLLPAFPNLWYRIAIPEMPTTETAKKYRSQKHHTAAKRDVGVILERLQLWYDKEISRIHESQVKWGFKFSETAPEGAEISPILI